MNIFIYIHAVHSLVKVTQSAADETAGGGLQARGALRYPAPLASSAAQTAGAARSTPVRISFTESCDYLAHYCLRAYNTGKLCGRTLYFSYHTFKNFCLMDYVNCMERYQVWQIVHMGPCFEVTELEDYMTYPYDDDYFLDQYYVLEDH